ncbi:MAG: SpoIIE family protein phosphatase [Chlamydiia bacterium]|nr:SpoIIE family protein phosphatase [Chlamydiia bacterium]
MEQEKKEKLHGSRGSLAARIFLIATLFLIVPLLVLIALLYVEDLRVKKENNIFTINVIMDQKVGLIEGMMTQELEVLSEVSYLLRDMPNRESKLGEIAKRDGVAAIFHLKKNGEGQYISDISSKEEIKGKDFTRLIHEAEVGNVLILDSHTPIFYLTRYVEGSEEAWVIALTLNHLSKEFPIERDKITPASISLVDSGGVVVSTTDHALKGRRIPPLKKGEYTLDGKVYFAEIKKVSKTNVSLLISAPERVNFVDIPFFFLKVLLAALLIVVVGGGCAIILTRVLAKPLQRLIHMMGHVARGDLDKRFTPSPMGFEINTVGEIFNETIDSLNEHIEAVHKERLEKETYEKELLIGEEVQLSILPKKLPTFPGVEMGARFIAAKEVGGDFYDFLSDGKLMISIADTSGKGISACLYSLSVRSMLRSYGELHQDLATILLKTNNLFCHDTGDSGVFVTAFVAFIDPKSRVFHYSNCGHFPALLQKKDGTIEKLTTSGMALGVVPFETVETKQKQLHPGDMLLLFTDGVVEAHNDAMEMFGEERLITSFGNKKGLSPKHIVDEIIEEVALFAEGCPQHDDLTLLVIKIV